MVDAYRQIGRRIVEEEQGGEVRAKYGSQLIRNLARALGDEFGRGFSVANLWNFRQFYLTFPDAGKLYALSRELNWTHWRLVMRVENAATRDYYIRECPEQAWSSRRLEREIVARTFDRLLVRPPAQAAPVPTDAQPSLGPTELVSLEPAPRISVSAPRIWVRAPRARKGLRMRVVSAMRTDVLSTIA
jgi:hypothetical protein